MPNQRKKGKKGISVYVPGTIHDALAEEAAKKGMSLSEYVTEIYRTELKQRGYKLDEGKENA